MELRVNTSASPNKTNVVAFIDGRPTPTSLTVPQIQVLFPQGLAGLYCVVTGEYVFPDANGVIRLSPGQNYAVRLPGSLQSFGGGVVEAGGLPASTPLVVPSGPTFASVDDEPNPNLSDSQQQQWDSDSEPRQGKLILDRVHEHVMLPMIVFDVIDTPEFQRLRGLKQLGSTSYLYPGATHTRFEHSIGVAHLAGLMVKKIARRQPQLNVTEADILCVTVAGLCHDVGHGPFSHLFEEIVKRTRTTPWHHEDMSIRLLRRILAKVPIARYGLGPLDVNFIALCIAGVKEGAAWPNDVGRPKEKRFLVDIVANKRSGIDVDKLDYFMRDSLCCYGRSAVDCHIPRLLSSCKVIEFEGEHQICFEEKLALSLGDIFTLRAKLHKYAYQHRIVKVVDHMITDVLAEADAHFFVRGSNGRALRISQCVDDEEGFIGLGDWIIQAMEASPDPALAKAQQIIRRIRDRDLYTVAGMALFARHQHRSSPHIVQEEILHCVLDPALAEDLHASMIVDFVKITYGSSDSEGNPDDPINNVTFYNPKSSVNRAFKLPKTRVSPLFSPSEFGEKSVIVLVRDKELAPAATAAFNRWKELQTRNLSVDVPVYNLSPGRPLMAKRMRDGSVQKVDVNLAISGFADSSSSAVCGTPPPSMRKTPSKHNS